MQAAKFSMRAKQPEAAEVFLGQALSSRSVLETMIARAPEGEGQETPLTLLFELVLARLQNAWSLRQQVCR